MNVDLTRSLRALRSVESIGAARRRTRYAVVRPVEPDRAPEVN